MKDLHFDLMSPPSDEQFEKIAADLLARLCDQTGLRFQVTHRHLEPASWITLKLRSDVLNERVIDLTYCGILSFSLRHGPPSIQSVLLAFSGGRRLRIGPCSILVSDYSTDGDRSGWRRFQWAIDAYDEWECDELPHS